MIREGKTAPGDVCEHVHILTTVTGIHVNLNYFDFIEYLQVN